MACRVPWGGQCRWECRGMGGILEHMIFIHMCKDDIAINLLLWLGVVVGDQNGGLGGADIYIGSSSGGHLGLGCR